MPGMHTRRSRVSSSGPYGGTRVRAGGARAARAPLEQLLELGAAQDLQVAAQRADLRARRRVRGHGGRRRQAAAVAGRHGRGPVQRKPANARPFAWAWRARRAPHHTAARSALRAMPRALALAPWPRLACTVRKYGPVSEHAVPPAPKTHNTLTIWGGCWPQVLIRLNLKRPGQAQDGEAAGGRAHWLNWPSISTGASEAINAAAGAARCVVAAPSS
jgi:hypothetical protein